jgi:hypothetical protein
LANYQPPTAGDAMTVTLDTSRSFDLDATVRVIKSLIEVAG